MNVQPVGFTTPLIAGDVSFTHNLSPDAMMVYLQTRLNGLDKQVNSIFNDQERQQKAQSALGQLEAVFAELDPSAKEATLPGTPKPAVPGAAATSASPLPLAPGSRKVAQTSPSPTKPASPTAETTAPTFRERVDAAIAEIRRIDPKLADKIKSGLEQPGQVLTPSDDNKYVGTEVDATRKYLEGIGKDLESAAQMNMIRLQSIMSTRQTAVQLATNLVASLGESTKAIVSNLGR